MKTFHSETFFIKSLNKYNEQRNIKTEYVSVWLNEKANTGEEMFYCPRCRFPILQFEGELVTILPGSSPSKLPIAIQCRGRDCGIKYRFNLMIGRG